MGLQLSLMRPCLQTALIKRNRPRKRDKIRLKLIQLKSWNKSNPNSSSSNWVITSTLVYLTYDCNYRLIVYPALIAKL